MRAACAVLAWIPFLHPINAFHDWSYLLLAPLAFGISVIYKAMRAPSLRGYWRSVIVMTVQIVLAMIALGIALTVIVQLVVPLVPIE